MCGCRSLGLRLEVSHDTHKGMGSKDDVSTADQMVLLCEHRHQHGRVSRHAGTLRAVKMDASAGYNGPVVWQVRRDCVVGIVPGTALQPSKGEWLTVAEEVSPGRLAQPHPWQLAILKALAQMEI